MGFAFKRQLLYFAQGSSSALFNYRLVKSSVAIHLKELTADALYPIIIGAFSLSSNLVAPAATHPLLLVSSTQNISADGFRFSGYEFDVADIVSNLEGALNGNFTPQKRNVKFEINCS